MGPEFAFTLFTLVVLTILGAPIAFSLMSASIVYLALRGLDLGTVAEQVTGGLFESFVAIAVPLFIFAARVMNSGSITERLLQFCLVLVGHRRGGLAQVNIVQSVVFSGMSGSAVADTAGMGYVTTQMMTKNGRYPAGFSCAVTISSSVIGPIIPPSIPMIFYALVSGTSLGALFLGGVVPGFLIAGFLMIVVAVISGRRGYPTERRIVGGERLRALVKAIPPLLMPAILLGGIYTGVFTPTEAAAVAGFYALFLSGIVYRELGGEALYRLFLETVRDTGVISMLIGSAFLFNFVVSIERVPFQLAAALSGIDVPTWALLLVLNVVFLILGCFLATSTIMLVCVPIVLPTVLAAGVDPVHFGVFIVINMMIGLITPPYGVLVFIIAGLTKTPVGEVIAESWIFIATLVAALLVITYVPETVLWLPRLAGY
jgi:tripartite ATP-independent transporter DctM subunit